MTGLVHRVAKVVWAISLLIEPGVFSASWADDPARPSIAAPAGDLEADADGDQWPDGWGRMAAGGEWALEDGNHFLRLTNPASGQMVMLYQEIILAPDVRAIELSWRQRVTGLQRGKEPWHDARILIECVNATGEKLSGRIPKSATGRDTEGWVEKSISFIVPKQTRTLKFMPCLFQVKAGTFELDDIQFTAIDPQPLLVAQEAADAEHVARQKAIATKRQAKAVQQLSREGSLISNGSFKIDAKGDLWPDDWGRVKEGGSWETEAGNHFLRMRSATPGTMVMEYRVVDLPADCSALELTWKQRVTGLKTGASPWFDARIMLEFTGADGKKLAPKPSPPYAQKDTAGWVEKRTAFLVPEGALSLVLMPCLFQVKAGTFDLDDLVLRPTDPAPLVAAAEKRAREVAARHVPPEEPRPDRWPPMIHVDGNRLRDPQGNEVWLQGVNAGGLETLPADRQVIKSVVVAIDEWKANCVRVPMNETFWYGKSAYQSDGGQEYRAILDQIVTLAANRGAYVVIDLHRFRAPKAEHAEFWKDCARHFKDHPAVLFDLFNEPHGISWEVWRNGGFVGTETGPDESAFLADDEKKKNEGFESVGMQGLVAAVRSTGAKNVAIAGGVFWCNDLSGVVKGFALDDPQGNGVMYSWHTYNWHKGWETTVLPAAQKFPIFVGELGADAKKMDFIPAADQEDPLTWVPDMLGFIQQHRLNWTGWCLHPAASPVMISDWSYTPTTFWGQFAKEALSGKKFELRRTR